MRPCIRAVKRDINRYITNNLYAFAIRISLQFIPLPAKLILQKHIEMDVFLIFLLICGQCPRLSPLNIIVPLEEALAIPAVLYRHK